MNERHIQLGMARSAIRELFEYGRQRAQAVGAENVHDFSLGNPSVPAPDCVKEEAVRLLNEMPAELLHGYTTATGDNAVRQAIAQHLIDTYGANVNSNLIYMTCGAASSLTVTLNALLSGGEEVIVISPYFPEYRVFIEGAKGVCREVRADKNFHPDIAAIEKAVTKNTAAVIINTPNNPSGVVYTKEELTALAALLRKKSAENNHAVYLISDEPYRELVYGKQAPFVANFYENTLVCYSFSKSLSLAGERIGYIAVNAAAEQAQTVYYALCGAGRDLGYVCAPALFQRVVAACQNETSDKSVYERNGKLLYDALSSYGYEVIKPEGAFYLFIKSPEADAAAFCERAKKYDVLIVPSNSFGITGYVRISTCVPTERIQKALPLFRALLEEYR